MMKLNSDIWRTFPIDSIPSSLSIEQDVLLSARQSDRILDLGCGLGRSLVELVAHGLDNTVGVDINELAIAEASIQCRINHGAKLVAGDIRRLPFSCGVFGLAILQAVLTIIPDLNEQALILSEAFRVLRPRGRLYLSDFGQTWSSLLYRERYIRGAQSLGAKATFPVFGSQAGEVLYYAHHFSMRELRQLLTDAGFRVIKARRKRLAFRTKSGNVIDGIVLIAEKP